MDTAFSFQRVVAGSKQKEHKDWRRLPETGLWHPTGIPVGFFRLPAAKRKEMKMKRDSGQETGIRRLLQKYRDVFRIPENLRYYSESDYKAAEKKFLKYAISSGKF
ncbi:MAG: hypothetical protein JW821_05830 [Deltaproteobacteria bacterium]|nr:hypothetical protein [Deltaproteobacteria bacterium]